MLIRNRRDDAPAIAAVYTKLKNAHPEMNKVFETYWPLVSSMFEDEEEQQEMAVKYYTESLEPTETIPQFAIDL